MVALYGASPKSTKSPSDLKYCRRDQSSIVRTKSPARPYSNLHWAETTVLERAVGVSVDRKPPDVFLLGLAAALDLETIHNLYSQKDSKEKSL